MTLHYISKQEPLPVKAWPCPDTRISSVPEKRLGILILKNRSCRDFDPLIVSVQRKVNLWLQWDLSITVEGFSWFVSFDLEKEHTWQEECANKQLKLRWSDLKVGILLLLTCLEVWMSYEDATTKFLNHQGFLVYFLSQLFFILFSDTHVISLPTNISCASIKISN